MLEVQDSFSIDLLSRRSTLHDNQQLPALIEFGVEEGCICGKQGVCLVLSILYDRPRNDSGSKKLH